MNYLSILKKGFSEWSADKASIWAASLAYFTVFSLSPLLLIIVGIMGLVFSHEAVTGELFGQIKGLVGNEGALFVQAILKSTSKPSQNIISTSIGLVTLFLGALGIFSQLQQAFNNIWKVKASPKSGIRSLIFDKIISFSMLLIILFLLAVSLLISVGISILSNYFNTLLPLPDLAISTINLVISFFVLTLLFALMFKILPDVQVPFKAVWFGAILTSLLFTIGKSLIGFYIGQSNYLKTYGGAGSVLAILVWVFYSAQIMLFGAEITKATAYEEKIDVKPSKDAVFIKENGLQKNQPGVLYEHNSNRGGSQMLGFSAFLIGVAVEVYRRVRRREFNV